MTKRIAIVGGGIGGLSAALLLLQRGFDVQVYERAPELLELGAGLFCGPNAIRILQSVGLSEGLARIGSTPRTSTFFRWRDGSPIASRRQGDFEELYGAPSYTVHRGELLSLLLSGVPAERVHVSHECVSIAQDSGGVRLGFGNGREVSADLVVGADGIHSVVRSAIVGPDKPQFSGYCAYRGLIPFESFQRIGEESLASCWMGPGAHVIHYPISSGDLINVVGAVTEPSWTRESWYDSASKKDYLAFFREWHPRLQAILAEVDETKLMKWALYDREELPFWYKGRVVLLGDAAHAMLPFMGQGAAQSMEDGAILARCLEAFPVDVAFETYERMRRPRASQLQQASRANGVSFHLDDGEAQRRRDAMMKEVMSAEAPAVADPVFAYNALEVELAVADEASAHPSPA